MNNLLMNMRINKNKLFKSDSSKSAFEKVRISFLAIVAGMVASSIFLIIKGNNPIYIFIDIFTGAFTSSDQILNMIKLVGVFIVAALAVAFAFQTGLFNIGVSGQLMISGGIAIILGLKTHMPWYLLIMISMVIGSIASGISGILKALFNVHEVVSTLLLNWVWFYIIKYLTLSQWSWMDNIGNSFPLSGASLVSGNLQRVIIIVFASMVSTFIIWFTLSKTTFGFSLKTVGKNKEAAKYAGIKVSNKIIYSMAISGMLAGLLGAMIFLLKDQQIKSPKTLSLPTEGFDGIAIALLAFNSPVGIIIISIFWSILNIGSQYMAVVNGISAQVVNMIIGIIIYFAAISVIFQKLKPIYILRNIFYNIKDKNIWNQRTKYIKAILENKKMFNLHLKKIKSKKPQTELLKQKKEEFKNDIKHIQNKYNLLIEKLKKEGLAKNIKNKKLLLLSLEESSEIAGIKKELQIWKEENQFNELKNTKNDKKISSKILTKEYVSRINKIKKERNLKNRIGITEQKNNQMLNLISAHEINISGIKLKMIHAKEKKDYKSVKEFKKQADLFTESFCQKEKEIINEYKNNIKLYKMGDK